MKVPAIPGFAPKVKQTISFQQQTANLLKKYKDCYEKEHGHEVQLTELIEVMLTTFMAEDKDFQKFLRQQDAPPKTAGTPKSAPTISAGQPSLLGTDPM